MKYLEEGVKLRSIGGIPERQGEHRIIKLGDDDRDYWTITVTMIPGEFALMPWAYAVRNDGVECMINLANVGFIRFEPDH